MKSHMFTLGQYYVTYQQSCCPSCFSFGRWELSSWLFSFTRPHPFATLPCFLALLASPILYYPCGITGRKKKKLVFPLGFWHRAPKSLSISLLTGMSFVLMRWLLVLPRWELVTRKTKSFKSVEILVPPPSLLQRRAGNRVNDLSWLCNKTSIKSPKSGAWGSFWVGEHTKVSRESLETPHPLPHTLLCVSFPSSYSIISFHNTLVIWRVSCILNSLRCSSRLTEQRRGSRFVASWSEAQLITWTCDWHLVGYRLVGLNS